MKICYLITSVEAGGAEFAIPDIANALRSFGHTVEIVALAANDKGAIPCLEKANLKYSILFSKRAHMLKILSSLIPLLMQKKPDLIMTSLTRATVAGMLSGLLLRLPVISWKNSTKFRVILRLLRSLSLFWISDSSSVSKVLNLHIKVPQDRIICWPLYISHTAKEERRYWNGRDVLHIGSSGRLCEQKNYDNLLMGISLFIKRFPSLAHKIHLSIAGEGPKRAELEKIVDTLQLNKHVSFLGFIDDIIPFLESLHVYTQPSHYEGLCIATHEAMATGLPVIATPVGELSSSVQEGTTGFVINDDASLPESFCRSLEYIFNNPSSVKKLGFNSQKYVSSNFSKEKYLSKCKETLDLFYSLKK